MKEEDGQIEKCDQCGSRAALAELMLDEESGLLLCPVCYLEQESCGCSDDDQGEPPQNNHCHGK